MEIRKRKYLANIFDALGHHRRISIFLEVLAAGKEGLTFGDLAKRLKMSEANLAHHVQMMKRGGVVSACLKGRFTILTLNVSQTEKALVFLALAKA